VDEADTMMDLFVAFESVRSLYIADGHHRRAAAVKVGLKRREAENDPEAEYNFTMSVIFPDTELHIKDYNRLVRQLNGMTQHDFLNRLTENFKLMPADGPVKPDAAHVFGLYLGRKWYRMVLANPPANDDPVAGLDVSILQERVLSDILGITDPRTDPRVDFVGGVRGLGELTRRVDSGEMTAAISMYPTSMEQLMDIADAGRIMPPKSTWFEPKLRSGLFVHTFS
jgi:uncharacterized protein (DUF1015 family)